MSSYYPPGLPSGASRDVWTVHCAWCRAAVDVVWTTDHATNCTEPDVETCRECGGSLHNDTAPPPRGCFTCAREGIYTETGGGPCADCKEGT